MIQTSPTGEGTKEWWSGKYAASNGYLYGKAPSAFMSEHLDLLRKGETLDVGMGEGRNGVYLASKGFRVTGLEWVEIAVERAKTLAKESGVSLETKLADLNFHLLPLMKYDTITVVDFKPPLTALKALVRALAPGGTLLIDAYTVEQLRLDQAFRPEPFECFKPNEPLEHIRDLHLVLYSERALSPKEARVQLIARKSLR